MDEHSEPPASIALIEALRQLATANQQIAQSLAEIKKLYAEESVKRDAERREFVAEKQEFKQQERHREEKFEKDMKYMKEREHLNMPRLPWQMQLVLGLVVVLLILLVLLLACHLFAFVSGKDG